MATPAKPRVERPPATKLNERLVDATLQLLREEVPTDLTVRRIATAAGTTTMALYTGFGSRDGLLDVVYARGFEQLRQRMAPAALLADPAEAVLQLLGAYRAFALANPGLYGLLFERVLPGFDPSPEVRGTALDTTFALLTTQTGRLLGVDRARCDGPRARLHALGADPRPGEPGAVARQPQSAGPPRAGGRRRAGRPRHGATGGNVGVEPNPLDA